MKLSPPQIKAGWRLAIIYAVLLTVGLLLLVNSARPNHTEGLYIEHHSTCIECEGTP